MPTESHPTLTRRFHTTFPDMHPPHQEDLFSFFKHHQLSCFIDKEAPMGGIETPQQGLIFLPISERLPDTLFQKCHCLWIECASDLPVILYWNWASPDPDRYLALRISLIPHRADSAIRYHIELCHPTSPSERSHTLTGYPPISSFIRGLEDVLDGVFTIEPMALGSINEPLEGASLYWSALSLFLSVCESIEDVREDFIKWHHSRHPERSEGSPVRWHYAKSMRSLASLGMTCVQFPLQFAPCLYTPLFYFEQSRPIFNMWRWIHQLGDLVIPSKVKSLPPGTLLHLLRVSAVFRLICLGVNYEEGKLTVNKEGYATLDLLPYLFAANLLNTQIRKKISADVGKQILFYLAPILSTGSHMGYNLYSAMPPGTPIQQATAIPRFIHPWIETMSYEFLILSTRMIFLALMFTLTNQLSDNTPAENPVVFWAKTKSLVQGLKARITPHLHTPEAYEAGFNAIILFFAQFLTWLITPFLFTVNYWKGPQDTEERAFLVLQLQCEPPCQLTITTPVPMRLVRQSFFNTQLTQLETNKTGMTTQCDLHIAPVSVPESPTPCYQATLLCSTRRFFERIFTNDTNAVARPSIPFIESNPPQTMVFCEEAKL
ncbi:MAG: hypothetical protein NTW08_01205 [Gammaproteobacteria bacterium]|nr:hypothetical protein [Gammaproteobacteria bacterium]